MSDVKLINGDCLIEMQKLIDEGVKVDMVLTDPPYGTTDCKWDSIIPLDNMWGMINELVYDKSPILLFSQEPFTTQLQYSNIENFKYTLYWLKDKSSGFLHSKNKPLVNVECISVFSNGDVNHSIHTDKRMTYNPQGLKKIKKQKMKRNLPKASKESVYSTSSFKNETYVQKWTNYPKMTIEYNTVPRNESVHPTQKPVDLLEYLIKTYSDEGDTVLDFTMGSGSTGVACLQTNRNFIGIELEQEYYEIAEQRIKEAKAQRRLI